eukprot:gene25419-30693_t
MASFAINPMNVSPSTSLFVGDLPKICTEYDLEQLFSPYGPILDVHLKRNAAVPYGFLTLSSIPAAEAAIRDMNGMMYMGRQIRVYWATNNAKSNSSASSINSVYVRYSTPRMDRRLSEYDLHRIFSVYGNVEEITIKDCHMDQRTGRLCGYAFVHYVSAEEGVQAAFQAVAALDNATIDGVSYSVEVSRNLLKQFHKTKRDGSGGGYFPPHASSGPRPSYTPSYREGGAGYDLPPPPPRGLPVSFSQPQPRPAPYPAAAYPPPAPYPAPAPSYPPSAYPAPPSYPPAYAPTYPPSYPSSHQSPAPRPSYAYDNDYRRAPAPLNPYEPHPQSQPQSQPQNPYNSSYPPPPDTSRLPYIAPEIPRPLSVSSFYAPDDRSNGASRSPHNMAFPSNSVSSSTLSADPLPSFALPALEDDRAGNKTARSEGDGNSVATQSFFNLPPSSQATSAPRGNNTNSSNSSNSDNKDKAVTSLLVQPPASADDEERLVDSLNDITFA